VAPHAVVADELDISVVKGVFQDVARVRCFT
jgi:hypothetical protein